jgi:hypothetical protein
MKAKEFLEKMKVGGFRKDDENEEARKRQEEDADRRALDELSAAIERNPIQSPRIRRG